MRLKIASAVCTLAGIGLVVYLLPGFWLSTGPLYSQQARIGLAVGAVLVAAGIMGWRSAVQSPGDRGNLVGPR